MNSARFGEILDRYRGPVPSIPPLRRAAVQRFLDPSSRGARYVVGRNAESEFLQGLLPLAGLIDDRAAPGSVWRGLPVLPMNQVPPDTWVLNASSSIAPVSVDAALARAGIGQRLALADLLASPDAPEGLIPSFVKDLRLEIGSHRSEWLDLANRLADDESRQILADVVRFRLNPEPAGMAGYRVRFEDQYFENFLGLHDETFVDAGGFDGNTTEQFCRRVPGYARVHFFEPSPVNMAKARQRLAGAERIVYHPIGLSDAAAELSFNASSGSASAVTEGGGDRIRVDRLDCLLDDPPGFMKMDLEGWELCALRGAAETIRQHQPKLAISVFHQASHFREVFQLVLALCPDYKVRLRHYTEGWSETVMFFSK